MQRIYRYRTTKVRFWIGLAMIVATGLVASRLLHVQIGAATGPVAEAAVRVLNIAPLALALFGVAWLMIRAWNAVVAFDVDFDEGRYRLWLWRPVGWREIEGDLDDISGWHYETRRPSRGPTRRAIRATLARPSLDLFFEIRISRRLDPRWRRIAPGAVAAYERETGVRV